MDFFLGFGEFLWLTFLLLAPMLLLGLLLSGMIHVFISREAILRWFRRDGLTAVSTSAAIGVPIPLCSCSVVPIVAEMRRKGASQSACMSFLITAPETGADSILVTNAFFGPVVAVTRPIISFLTAVGAGLAWIVLSKSSHDPIESEEIESLDSSQEGCEDCEHDHQHHESLFADRDDCYVSPRELYSMCVQWLGGIFRHLMERFPRLGGTTPSQSHLSTVTPSERLNFPSVVRHIFRYGFIEIADDILFALLVGIALGGVLYFAIPSDLMTYEYANWLAYPIMVLIGIPLYICASASTPIAAALVAKGVSPGAALVFLMTGPATNTGTIAIILKTFGARFTTTYIVGVIIVTVILGLAIDFALLTAGVSIAVNLDASESATILTFQCVGAIVLISLVIWRFRAGALRSGYADMMVNLRPATRRIAEIWRR